MKTKLTAENVTQTLFACFYKDGEDTAGHIKVQGVRGPLGLNPDRVKENSEKIKEMLFQMPKEFLRSGGGGYTFLNGCIDANGSQWGDQSNVDELICLGMAIGRVSFQMPREMWSVLPGGMPYFSIDDTTP